MRPYRSRRGVILGVCRGLAEHLDFPVFWLRVIFVVGTLFTSLWPGVVLYFIAGILMKLEPVIPIENDVEQEFYNSFTTERATALRRLKRTFDNLDRRIRRMEDIVTARDFDWEQQINQ